MQLKTKNCLYALRIRNERNVSINVGRLLCACLRKDNIDKDRKTYRYVYIYQVHLIPL